MVHDLRDMISSMQAVGLQIQQTNARLRELGKGFAVVADEIRSMAENSKHSAKETIFNKAAGLVECRVHYYI